MLPRDILCYCIPLYIDDINTFSAYVRSIKVDQQTIEKWRQKNLTFVDDRYESCRTTWYRLANGLPHGKLTYSDKTTTVEGRYRNGVPVGTFFTSWSMVGYSDLRKEITYVNGVKSTVVAFMTKHVVICTVYKDGVRVGKVEYDSFSYKLLFELYIDEYHIVNNTYGKHSFIHVNSSKLKGYYVYVNGVRRPFKDTSYNNHELMYLVHKRYINAMLAFSSMNNT
jgi:hypothetical protein